MDIDSKNYWASLPTVLEAISEAEFVAIDMEMSGVRVKPTNHGPTNDGKAPRDFRDGKLSLAQAYEEARDAAEMFQILQLGLTCVSYDDASKKYMTKSFNFHVTPLCTGEDGATAALARLLDRNIAFSQKALAFLKSHEFHIDDAFSRGIPYLSQAEEHAIVLGPFMSDRVPTASQREAGPQRSVIDIQSLDTEGARFYASTKAMISAWDKNPRAKDYLNIEPPYGDRLNSLQIRLVRQIVETEFPDGHLGAQVKQNWFMQVTKQGNVKEDKFWEARLEERRVALTKQKGLGWVIDAITGGLFVSRMRGEMLLGDANDDENKTKEGRENRARALEKLKKDLLGFEEKIRRRRPFVVVHNSLTDLCFLYHHFYGPLPSKVQQFAWQIQFMFPRMVDTKYMVTRGAHSMLPDENLEELFRKASKQELPEVEAVTGLGYLKKAAHQAGYDSYMTALVFIKKSWEISSQSALPDLDYPSPSSRRIETTSKRENIWPWQSGFKVASDWRRVGNRGNDALVPVSPATPRIKDDWRPVVLSGPKVLLASQGNRAKTSPGCILDEDNDLGLGQGRLMQPLVPLRAVQDADGTHSINDRIKALGIVQKLKAIIATEDAESSDGGDDNLSCPVPIEALVPLPVSDAGDGTKGRQDDSKSGEKAGDLVDIENAEDVNDDKGIKNIKAEDVDNSKIDEGVKDVNEDVTTDVSDATMNIKKEEGVDDDVDIMAIKDIKEENNAEEPLTKSPTPPSPDRNGDEAEEHEEYDADEDESDEDDEDTTEQDETKKASPTARERAEAVIPAWDSAFFRRYANKIRVAHAGVLVIRSVAKGENLDGRKDEDEDEEDESDLDEDEYEDEYDDEDNDVED